MGTGESTAINIEDIKSAALRIKPYIHQTPLITSQTFNDLLKAEIYFKCENLQKAGAFKSRGAVNAVFSLHEEDLKKGVCTHSSGNHAQALARAAGLRNVTAYIVMPETSPKAKVNAVKGYGGKITFCKPTLEAREKTLKEIREKTSAIEIHPYNNRVIIRGQATAALEIFETGKQFDIIMAPVGGGGLMSGTAITTRELSPGTQIIGAEPLNANDACKSFYSGIFHSSVNPNTIADGLLTSLGSITFPIIRQHVDDIITVKEESIKKAMWLIWERMKMVVEPSSAVPLGALLERQLDVKGKKIAIILSGGNVDLNKLPWA